MESEKILTEVTVKYKDDPKAREEFAHFMVEHFLHFIMDNIGGEN